MTRTRKVAQTTANAGARSLAYALTVSNNKAADQLLKAPGLRIDGGSASAVAEAQNAFYALVQGTLLLKAAGQNMPAIAGTVTNATFGLFVWVIDSAGTITQLTLVTGATLAALVFPEVPAGKALIGFLVVNPTGTGNFVGGTTNLDDATVVPNAVFFDGHTINACDWLTFRETGTPTL